MTPPRMSRRHAILALATLPLAGCSALASLNAAAAVLDTYDLRPAAGATGGRRTSSTLVIARPDAPAVIATDRIMVRSDAASVTYLPDARWSDDLPLVVQSLLVRAIAGTGRIGYVGPAEGGPVPDAAMLVRLDAFEVTAAPEGGFSVAVGLALTLLADREQRVIAARRFQGGAAVTGDSPPAVVAAFQGVLDDLLPQIADWTLAQV